MTATQPTREHIENLTIRATAINTESAILRQAWSENFHLAKDRDRGSHLLAQISDLTAQASTIQQTLFQLQEPESATHRPAYAWQVSPERTEQRAVAEDTTCVLCRQRTADGSSCGLIIGVFPSVADAMLYAQTREAVAIHEWQLLRTGKPNWVRPGEKVSFTIEVHTMQRPLMQPLVHPMEHIVAMVV